LQLSGIHHIAIICSEYEHSKDFYTRILGLQLIRETWRAERHSFKADLALNGQYVIELFSFPNPPARPSRPESCGLRHLAFATADLDQAVADLRDKGVETEPIRLDHLTGRRFTFFADPDGLPLELYETITPE